MNTQATASKPKYLTRYSREKTSFDGWRVCISKQGLMFTKYISDREFGGEEGSKRVALALRDELLGRLEKEPADVVIPEYQERYARKPRK